MRETDRISTGTHSIMKELRIIDALIPGLKSELPTRGG